jgi:HK97 gp10 family phage protein
MARNVVVTDIDLGYDAILEEIEELQRSTLLVGIQEQAKTQSQTKNGRTQKAGLSVAEYAAKNEFGTREIPQRSFMRTAFDENIALIEKAVAIQYGKVIDGDISLQAGLGIVGQVIVGLIQRKIRAIVFPPNSPATIAKKGSSKPLIDFGQMVKSVTYAIRTKK